MKFFKKVFILVLPFFLLTGCGKKGDVLHEKDSFKEAYTNVSEDHVFKEKSIDEIIKVLENGTGLVFLGFPECKWCQAYVPYLNDVAKDNNVEVIYYYNILEARKDNTDDYQKIVSLLSDYLQFDDEGNKRVYVPAVVAVNNGEIVGFDDETSLDTHDLDDPSEYWTKIEVADLESKLHRMILKIDYEKCTDCNK
ncbi:MAG: hypothetical protein K2M17_03075 [Bacilli bacterium]|nr:hypothetical protein [Bacilli bacterium]